MIPASAYIRVSDDSQVIVGASLPSQLEAIYAYAERNGYVISPEHVYSEEGVSARTADRPAFQRMISTAKSDNCPWKAIICWENSRFARSREDAIVYKSLLRKKRITLCFVKQDFDDTPVGRLMEGIVEIIDQWYSENLAIETKRGQTQNAKAGYSTGGRPPYGLRRVEVRNEYGFSKVKWEPDEETAGIVKRIYLMYADGAGYKKIAYLLNAESIPSPSGGTWNANTLYYILFRNQYAYLGTQIYNREDNTRPGMKEKPESEWTLNPNAWASILTPEDVAAVNAKKGTLTKRRYKRDGSINSSATPFILTGKLTCGVCGASVTGATGGRKGQNWRYYRCCKSKSAGSAACDLGSIAQWKAEGAVIQAIKDYFINPDFIADVLKDFKERAQIDNSERDMRLDNLSKAIERKEKERQKIISMTIKGLLSDEEGHLFISQSADELRTLLSERASLEMTKNFDYDGHAVSVEEFRKDVARILDLGNTEAYAGMIDTMISKVILFPDHVHIEFEWDPSLVNKALPVDNTVKQIDLSKIGGEGGI